MQIHYFQRYQLKENVDTANTMLMLSRLYDYNADKFFYMLNSLILKADNSPELTFNMQVSGPESVPDAVISQKSFKIVVETKLYNQFEEGQLVNHLEQFGTEDYKVLLTLDPQPMNIELRNKLQKDVDEYNDWNKSNVKHVNITFEELVEAMEDIVDDRDIEILKVLEDFKNFCLDEKLISNSKVWMRAITAGTTINDNKELSLYYDQEARNYSEHGYIGLYTDKSIRAIGKLDKTILAVERDGAIEFEPENGKCVTAEDKERIREAIKRAEAYGYDLHSVKHRYFMVEKFYDTDFRKSSKNPIFRTKLFNLADIFNCASLPETNIIAETLNGKTWEEYNL